MLNCTIPYKSVICSSFFICIPEWCRSGYIVNGSHHGPFWAQQMKRLFSVTPFVGKFRSWIHQYYNSIFFNVSLFLCPTSGQRSLSISTTLINWQQHQIINKYFSFLQIFYHLFYFFIKANCYIFYEHYIWIRRMKR